MFDSKSSQKSGVTSAPAEPVVTTPPSAVVAAPAATPPPAPQGVATSVVKASFGGLVKRSFQIYKKQWWKLLLIAFLPITAIAVSLIVGMGLLAISPFLLIPFVLVLIVLIPWFSITTMHIIADAEQGVGFGEASKRGFKQLVPAVWLSLLSSLVMFGGFLLIIPGIIWAVSFQLVFWVLVTEDKRGMDAILRVRQLIKGDWWRVFLNLLGFGILTMIAGSVFSGLAELLKDAWGGVVQGIQTLIWIGFITPLTLCFSFAIFEDFKKWKTPSETPKKKLWFILAAIAGPVIFVLPLLLLFGGAKNSAVSRSQDAKRISHIRQIQTALELGRSAENTYPHVVGWIRLGKDVKVLCVKDEKIGFYGSLDECTGTVYMDKVPENPSPRGKPYFYTSIEPDKYLISFELGGDIGVLKSGPNCASQDGIKEGDCPDSVGNFIKKKSEVIAEENEDIATDTGEKVINNSPYVPVVVDWAGGGKEDDDGDGVDNQNDLYDGEGWLHPDDPLYGLDPEGDEDGDGMLNVIERQSGLLDAGANGWLDPFNPDTDGDGLADGDEYIFLTSAVMADSDGDGFEDADELIAGYDPAGLVGEEMTQEEYDEWIVLRITNFRKNFDMTFHEITKKTLEGTKFIF